MFSVRKWGFYLTVWRWSGIKVKLLYFKRGHAISIQRHFFRSEDWKVLFGGGRLSAGENLSKLSIDNHYKGSRFHIPVLTWHRFVSFMPTLILETQRGQPHEKDIERVNI